MKPWKADQLKSTGEALDFVQSRVTVLQSLCRAALDVTMDSPTSAQTVQDLLNRTGDLIRIAEDEIDHLFYRDRGGAGCGGKAAPRPPIQ